ncbi:tetratricopeptide repeat protein [Colwellia psychrerythraea]|uniref:TPR domain protein n=1 Tax=Colwellia psychrerythraea (strain 34H / ATCC BAA-681) TaxID=167879 RepID=Q482C2_COLP3|nr:tetratricopeptide repeat protein [Colwellia psychrerythraea]AAZ27903.1 TPR domain protein [Colwellia psychrerythraea 34H]
MQIFSITILFFLSSFAPHSFANNDPVPSEKFIGKAACANCHQQQFNDWKNSHHDLAMQPVNKNTVLGDFDQTKFSFHNTTAEFYRQNEQYFVKTQNKKGVLTEYKILYTFGFTPLQQYLVDFGQGRLQALSIAWDSRPKTEGGQRWYHLQADQGEIPFDDMLHWTGSYFNWNSRCAECHSTGFEKNFDDEKLIYNSTWTDIDVACESCHGAGKDHQMWAKNGASIKQNNGLINLAPKGLWQIIPDRNTAQFTPNKDHEKSLQLDTCAHCHSRRSALTENYLGKKFDESHHLQLLDENIYHSDGQIQDEDYVYGSFIQSKMYHEGVVCSNCHEPHSLKLRAPDNAVCTQCHKREVFDTPKHHQHDITNTGAQCVNCHMPETTYMSVDPRRDHSLRIPRPDLSKKLGLPNACNTCHQEQSIDWAVKKVESWYPTSQKRMTHFAKTLYAGRKQWATGHDLLNKLAHDTTQASIVKASALSLLTQYPTQETLNTAIASLKNTDSKIQRSALGIIEMLPTEQAYQHLASLLDTSNSYSNKAIRMEVARVLAAVPLEQLPKVQAQQLANAQNNYIISQLVNNDTANSHQNLALFYAKQGQISKAEQLYKKALSINTKFVPAMVNLADLYRQTGKDSQATVLLFNAVKVMPENAMAQFALGLQQVRQKNMIVAIKHLQIAAGLSPNLPYYHYVYAVALDTNNETKKAVVVLENSLRVNPNDQQLISSLISYYQKLGDIKKVQFYMAQYQQ